MPKRKTAALDHPIASAIFNELDLYARDRQFYPAENALYGHMTRLVKQPDDSWKRYYDLPRGLFRYWFGRLVEEGHIKVDRDTRAIRCVHLKIVDRADVS